MTNLGTDQSGIIIEVDINPLDLSTPTPSESNCRIINKRGRPKSKDAIKFGPLPKSLVAQMLSKLKTESSEILETTVIEDDNESIHQSQDEGSEPDRDFICEICCHRSGSTKEHERHLISHKHYACDYPGCSYSCKLSCNLIKHKRIHTDEKPYFCESCAFRTNFINSLKTHKRTHTSERPYECKNCSYKCNSSSNLKKHCLHRHPESQ